jgi:hypothetical protein
LYLNTIYVSMGYQVERRRIHANPLSSGARRYQNLVGATESVGTTRREHRNRRDVLCKERNGRPKAADIQERVHELAIQTR